MKALHAMERRLQDLQRKFENKERLGKIVDVKFENQRWMVKMNDGEDQGASGGERWRRRWRQRPNLQERLAAVEELLSRHDQDVRPSEERPAGLDAVGRRPA